jgi:hypothetical protein
MLYFFHGIDSQKAGEKANSLVKKMLDKKPGASLFVINDENCTEDTFQEMTQSSALFENKYIVQIKRVLDEKETSEIASAFLKEIKDSENIFIWNEGEVSKTILKKIEKSAEKIIDVGGSKKAEEKTKIFDICNPIINRDKKILWVRFHEMLELYAPEELHGTFFWQFKNIAIASKVSQTDSGIAPFPYNNAKKALNNYSEKEILEKTSELSKIVHESRVGGVELPIALERFVLNI